MNKKEKLEKNWKMPGKKKQVYFLQLLVTVL